MAGFQLVIQYTAGLRLVNEEKEKKMSGIDKARRMKKKVCVHAMKKGIKEKEEN